MQGSVSGLWGPHHTSRHAGGAEVAVEPMLHGVDLAALMCGEGQGHESNGTGTGYLQGPCLPEGED